MKNALWKFRDLQRCIAAWHEAGHALIILMLMPECIRHARIGVETVRGRSRAAGAVAFVSQEEPDLVEVERMFAALYGGGIGCFIGFGRSIPYAEASDRDMLEQVRLADRCVTLMTAKQEEGDRSFVGYLTREEAVDFLHETYSDIAVEQVVRIAKGEFVLCAEIARALYQKGRLERDELLALRDRYATGNTYD